ncbi:hypothetical protein CL55_00013620 [Polynucleobacter duraquae]|uniref:Uncharacterized protein n=1 Tax=Polynucleobacter duraquae TaxID=1835254 RepID=A0A0E3ZME8_9BURK|nr:hypothetical protein CL55_00013620 [Polynucleobacter duraquae]
MSSLESAVINVSQSEYSLWEKLCIYRDQLIANSRFQNAVSKIPFINRIAKKEPINFLI